MKPDKEDETIGITYTPHNPDEVVYIPNTWKKWLAEKRINVDMNAIGILILSDKLERFSAKYVADMPMYRERDPRFIWETLTKMVEAGMTMVVEDSDTPEGRVYAIRPEFVYDPKTGLAKA